MSRLATAGADQGSIPDEIPTLLTLANFSRGCVMPDLKTHTAYPPLTVKKMLEAQAKHTCCQELRAENNRNANSRLGESPDGLLVQLAPLDRAVQVVMPKKLQQDVLTIEHESAHAGI